MAFEAIIFDCDGVLVDSEILGLEASAAFLRGHGFSWNAADLIRIFTGHRDDVFARKLIDAYREIHGKDPDTSLFEGLVEIRRRKRDQLRPVPGAEDAVMAIEHKKAVASSSRTTFLNSKLARTGLDKFFAPHIYSADLVAHGKPAPDIFLYTAEKLQTAPEHCLVIEDSAAGVRAGVDAGMTVWGFTGGGHCFDGHGERLVDAGAERVVPNFAALAGILA